MTLRGLHNPVTKAFPSACIYGSETLRIVGGEGRLMLKLSGGRSCGLGIIGGNGECCHPAALPMVSPLRVPFIDSIEDKLREGRPTT